MSSFSPHDSKTNLDLIQKSTPLLSLWKTNLTLAEFKILDAYLARIDSHHPENRTVRFSKGELENILGVKRIHKADLKNRLQHLGLFVEITEPFSTDLDMITLFERATCTLDKQGRWIIDLTCSERAMRYIFNIENIGYLRYRLRSVLNLNSRYSYLLFLYIEQNRFRGEWEVSVDELREILSCSEEGLYGQFKYFNNRILKRSQQELFKKTKTRFSYQPLKTWKYVDSIKFQVFPLESEEISISPKSFPSIITDGTDDIPQNDLVELLWSACSRNGIREFSRNEIFELKEIMRTIPLDKLPNAPSGPNLWFRLHHHLAERYAELCRRSEKIVINNRFAYLRKMLLRDAEIYSL